MPLEHRSDIDSSLSVFRAPRLQSCARGVSGERSSHFHIGFVDGLELLRRARVPDRREDIGVVFGSGLMWKLEYEQALGLLLSEQPRSCHQCS